MTKLICKGLLLAGLLAAFIASVPKPAEASQYCQIVNSQCTMVKQCPLDGFCGCFYPGCTGCGCVV